MDKKNKEKKKFNPWFWLGYAWFLLFIIEISLRVFFAIPGLQNQLLVNDSFSWQRQWVYKHKQSGNEIYYSFDQYDPKLGWISKPNLRDLPVFDNKFLNTNNLGLRGTADYPFEKNPEKTRIIILGDSFTFGDEVSDDETYAHYLQTLLPQAEVINMGVHGYGHDQMLLLFLEKGIKFQPDIVILGFNSADMERNVLRFRDFAKPQFVTQNDQLILRNSPVPTPEEIQKSDWFRPRLLDALSMIQVGAKTRSGARQIEEEAITGLILDQWVDATNFYGAIPVLAYLPFGDELTSQEVFTKGENFLFSYCDTNPQVYCFSTRSFFMQKIQSGDALFTPFHWDPSGNLAVAESIYDYLVDVNHWITP